MIKNFIYFFIPTIINLFSCNDLRESQTFLALGDSYTIGESVIDSLKWPNILIRQLNNNSYFFEEPKIIAKTGWTSDELITAIDSSNISEKFNYVSLLIGVNNQYRGRNLDNFEKDLKILVQKSIDFAANNPKNVFTLSIPDWGVMPFAKDRDQNQIAFEIDQFNNVIERISNSMDVNFIDITQISRDVKNNPNYIAVDGLHPSGEMYKLWVNELLSFFLKN